LVAAAIQDRETKEFDYARAGEIEEHKRRRVEEAATSAANTSGVSARPACPCDQATLGASLAGRDVGMTIGE
jgi:hypothetical protein